MRVAFWGKDARGIACLHGVLAAGFQVVVVIVPPGGDDENALSTFARGLGLPVIETDDPNSDCFYVELSSYEPHVSVLAGYGKILSARTIGIPLLMSINLHAGRLPDYRGSSPMNWALIRGDRSFTISVIKVDSGVDTGDILLERSFSIAPEDTIRELHATANRHFPDMVVEVLRGIGNGSLKPRSQDKEAAGYFPLRFPDDGLIVWDMMSAEDVVNRIRALTDPYPCAFTYYKGRKVMLTAAETAMPPHFGNPGRIYRLSTSKGMLVCAADRCLWIGGARFADTGEDAEKVVNRYDEFWSLGLMMRTTATLAELALRGKQ